MKVENYVAKNDTKREFKVIQLDGTLEQFGFLTGVMFKAGHGAPASLNGDGYHFEGIFSYQRSHIDNGGGYATIGDFLIMDAKTKSFYIYQEKTFPGYFAKPERLEYSNGVAANPLREGINA